MESQRIRVAIWDDRPEQLASLLARLNTAVKENNHIHVELFNKSDIESTVKSLEDKFEQLDPIPLAVLSAIDVLCIDYDLRAIKNHSWLTADTLAGLVRAFSDCPCVVVLNRPPRVAFDLSMLAFWDAAGDVHLLPEAVARPETWCPIDHKAGEPRFKPWAWPDFFAVRELVNRRLDDLDMLGSELAHTDVLEFFDFDKERREYISWRALGALSSAITSNDPSITFQAFLRTGARSLLADKLEVLDLNNDHHRPIALRVLTFELARWLREQVADGQDVLVDLPHLAGRAQWLLQGDVASSSEALNELAAVRVGETVTQFPEWIEEHRFAKAHWIGRPVYFWEDLQRDERFTAGFQDFDEGEVVRLCFAEDQSRFMPMSECRDFVAGFGNIWDQRFVGPDQGHHLPYGPLVRFAM